MLPTALALQAIRSESEPHAPLNLPRSADCVHSRAVAYAETGVVVRRGCAIQGTRTAGEYAGHCRRWQVEVSEVKEVEDTHARLDSEPLPEGVSPRHSQIQGLQPGEVDLVAGRGGDRLCDASKGL